ncbi:MAG: pyridoxine 5'-phosphate synthase [bacterium]
MPKLGVNVDHVATVRQARKVKEPDPIIAAMIAELAGADSIVVHLREDRRHIQERDVRVLREIITTKLNLEMASTDAMVKFALSLKPDQATLVPERREELTTEGGLNVIENKENLASAVNLLQDAGIVVSLFVDPDISQIKTSSKINVTAIELHTGNYANATSPQQAQEELEKLEDAASFAIKQGLVVNVGHGLNYQNVIPIASIHGINELNIGHSIIARAILVGMDEAVREMLELVRR